jgi:hypothetical protein
LVLSPLQTGEKRQISQTVLPFNDNLWFNCCSIAKAGGTS